MLSREKIQKGDAYIMRMVGCPIFCISLVFLLRPGYVHE